MSGYSVSESKINRNYRVLTEEIDDNLGLLDFWRRLHQRTVDDYHARLSACVGSLLRLTSLRLLLANINYILNRGHHRFWVLLWGRVEAYY